MQPGSGEDVMNDTINMNNTSNVNGTSNNMNNTRDGGSGFGYNNTDTDDGDSFDMETETTDMIGRPTQDDMGNGANALGNGPNLFLLCTVCLSLS